MRQLSPIEHYTVADYLLWEGDWELIQGMPLSMTPSPGITHQRVSKRIVRQLDEALDDCADCETLFEIDVEFSQETVVRPDVIVICHVPDAERLTRAPELIFEVVSKKTARRDEKTKFRLYADEAVAHYVLVYPEAREAKVYRLINGEYRKIGDFHDQAYSFELSKCAVPIDFSRLW